MTRLNEFANKNVLITGGGRGIGKRLALGFAKHGARIGLIGRSKAEIDLAHIEIEQAGGNALRIRADVTDAEQIAVAVDRVRVSFGPVDVLVCAAAIQGPLTSFLQSSPKSWIETMNVNFFGVVHSCRAVLPSMVERRSGKIIVLACENAGRPHANFSAYATSKTSVARFVETIAIELSEHNIQVNCLDPGPSYTNMTDEIIRASARLDPQVVTEAIQTRSTGGVTADLQMQLASFLASEKSNHITGKLIHVNDDWKKLKTAASHADLFTLRRMVK